VLRLVLAGLAAATMPAVARAQTPAPGAPAPEPVTRELQQALAAATQRSTR